MLKLYNSLTKQVEEFKPIKDGQVTIYTCGPTVYDHVQIGNLRTYIFDDTLRRALNQNDYKVNHVINITDVDDKTIRRSQQDYPHDDPATALGKLTRKYEDLFYKDAKSVGIDYKDSKVARATEHITEMQALIAKIANKYLGDDGVYYEIGKDKDYGVLVKLDRAHEHHRIDNDEYDKDHVADFALWKTQVGDEPAWDFELEGKNVKGRPGWHIECSAMSTKYLGQPFDVHTGGIDLIFPHHENEIAQSRSAEGKPLANYFIHGEHLLVDGKKMSKSLNNFYTVKDLADKGFDPLAFRFLNLQAHYRSQLNFTWESLGAAAQRLKDLQAWADLVHQSNIVKQINSTEHSRLKQEIDAALQSDLDTPRALAKLSEFIDKVSPSVDLLNDLDKLFGLNLGGRPDISDEQKEIIALREKVRNNNDYTQSDQLRDELLAQGIGVRDTDNGTVWYRA